MFGAIDACACGMYTQQNTCVTLGSVHLILTGGGVVTKEFSCFTDKHLKKYYKKAVFMKKKLIWVYIYKMIFLHSQGVVFFHAFFFFFLSRQTNFHDPPPAVLNGTSHETQY